MKLKLILMISLLSAGLLASCAPGPVKGSLFQNTRFEGAVNPATEVTGARTGQGCNQSYLGLIVLGDSSVGTVAQNNGITQIARVDHSSMNILGLYTRYCTIVSGN